MDLRNQLRSLRSRRCREILSSGFPYLLAALLLLALSRSPIPETLDLLLYDLITTFRPAPSGRSQPITILGIEEKDITRYGWPIDDRLLCRAIDRLLEGGASVIALDLYRDQGVGAEQDCLRSRFSADPRLISIFNVAEGIGAVPGTPPQRRAFNDLVLDADGVVRRDLVHVAGQDLATVSLPMRALEMSSGNLTLRKDIDAGRAAGPPWLEPASGGYEDLDAAGYQEMMVYRKLGSYSRLSLQDLLENGTIPPDAVRDHIVLIGSTAPSLRDYFPVPHTRFTFGIRQLLVSGVELHAHRLAALLDQAEGNEQWRVHTLPGWGERGVELVAIVLGIVLGESFRLLRHSVLTVGVAAGALSIGSVLFLHQHIWIGLCMPLTGLVGMAAAGWVRRGGVSQQQRQQIERLLGQTTSPSVARQLWAQREELLSNGRFEGRQLPVTVLMLDTCNFSTISEQMPPGAVLEWINRGMAHFVPAITRRGGMVNKFTGDGLLAVFGAPLSEGTQSDARSAVEAALAIQEAVEILDRELSAENQPGMRLRVGIHSGDVLAGSVGSSERLEYGVIGDAVNCAARLEAIEKERQSNLCRVLASSSTRDLLPPDVALLWKEWGSMHVKGRQQPLRIWELLGKPPTSSLPVAGASVEKR